MVYQRTVHKVDRGLLKQIEALERDVRWRWFNSSVHSKKRNRILKVPNTVTLLYNNAQSGLVSLSFMIISYNRDRGHYSSRSLSDGIMGRISRFTLKGETDFATDRGNDAVL